MDFRQVIASIRQALPTIVAAVVVIGGAVLVVSLLPGRTAAVIIGVAAAALVTYFLVRQAGRATQIALLWLMIGISADAAYARVNDQVPITIAYALVKVAEGLIKLGDILIRSVGITLAAGDPRVRPLSVAPEFVWALILALIVFLALSLMRGSDAPVAARRL